MTGYQFTLNIILIIWLLILGAGIKNHIQTGDCIYQHQYESDYLAPYGESVAACTKE